MRGCSNHKVNGCVVVPWCELHKATYCCHPCEVHDADKLRAEVENLREALDYIRSGGCADLAGWADLHLPPGYESKLAGIELQVESSRKALEEIVCMQHMHEGAGGCHGGCPICCASVAIGLDKYLRNPGDKEKVETLSVKHGYTEKPKGAPCYMCHGSGTRGGLPCPECAVKQMDLRQPKTLDDLTEIR